MEFRDAFGHHKDALGQRQLLRSKSGMLWMRAGWLKRGMGGRIRPSLPAWLGLQVVIHIRWRAGRFGDAFGQQHLLHLRGKMLLTIAGWLELGICGYWLLRFLLRLGCNFLFMFSGRLVGRSGDAWACNIPPSEKEDVVDGGPGTPWAGNAEGYVGRPVGGRGVGQLGASNICPT